ncbi:hypothetical protein KY321_04360 [Candidatus Woesearchaeota archaeon]|nr:hypothetical protein [Candidatus Woesearchaeota archaeon]
MLEELKKRFEEFCKGNDFELNDDEKFLNLLLDGLITKKEKEGQYFCPCRFSEDEISLLCPCDFKSQENWETKNQCWCGLFKKK